MKILTIVVTYNGSKWIDRCFGSLITSSVPIDIFAIDNKSNDNTVELIQNKFPTVEILEIGENLGFGKANNLGMQKALVKRYDYVLLLNQDAWIEKDTIEKLIDNQKANKEYGVIVPLQLNGKGEFIDKLFMEFTIGNNRELVTEVFRSSNDLHKVDFANAACWLMPISTIEKIGGFDPLFPHYGEDDDYLNRVKKHGMKVGLNINTNVFHDREYRRPKTNLKDVVNESYTRELISLKNPLIKMKPQAVLVKEIFKSGIKFITSAFNRYYIYKIIAYTKILKIYNLILDHRKEELKIFHHYLKG